MRIIAHRLLAGAPAPAFHAWAHREYYRFLFAGVLVFVGCLMPFGPQPQPGYYALSGGVVLVIALGVIWSMWGAIHTGQFGMKWIVLMVVPLAWSASHVLSAFTEPALHQWVGSRSGGERVASWPAFFAMLLDRDQADRLWRASEFFRLFGPGKVLIFAGSLFAEVYLLIAVFRGMRRASRRSAGVRAAGVP
jgi:O-antigen ligase